MGAIGRIRCRVASLGWVQSRLTRTPFRSRPSFRAACGPGHEGRELNMKTFLKMLRDESGASAAEYALILAIVGSALAIAAITLGNTISSSMNNQGQRIADCEDGDC